jgi:3-oxoacyl-[acyl-carrier protein] reductase
VGINLKGVFNMTRVIAPLMIELNSGCVVNMASVVGMDGNIGQTNYAATKAGVIGMTKTWAKEFARKGAQVRCNAVAPGFIATPMTEKVPQKILDAMISKTPLARMGSSLDVARAVVFLSSENASFITGQVLRVDGGLVF